MFLKNLQHLIGSLVLASLAACGGGGGSPGSTGNGGPGTVPQTTSTGSVTSTVAIATDFIFELDKQSLATGGTDKVLLTVLAVDSNRNVVANVPVAISIDADAVFSGVTSGNATNANGQYAGTITSGGNKSNRVVTAKITVSGIVKTASISVIGSVISITPVPATPAPGQSVSLNLASLDSLGSSVANVQIGLSGTAGATGTVTTDISGQKVITFLAPATPGSYTVIATGLGISVTKPIQVISAGGGGFPDAIGTISSVSLSPQPSLIAPNQAGATTNRAKVTTRFLTPANSGVSNMRVRFEILQPALGAGEAISTGDSVVYSDVGGIAEAEYIAGSRTSPTNGVRVRACYKASNFTSVTDCPNFVITTLTVAGTPLSISIGSNNKIEKGLGEIAYVKKFLIQVNDAAGVAVKDAIVSVSVDITHYGKGIFGGAYPAAAPTLSDPSLPSSTTSPGFISGISGPYANVWCVNEDRNRNGSLDVNEDVNGDGVISPKKANISVAYASGNSTDANGQMLVQVTYAQNFGSWLSYTLRATTQVAGSEGDASSSSVTAIAEEDLANGSFRTPPYGFGSCADRN